MGAALVMHGTTTVVSTVGQQDWRVDGLIMLVDNQLPGTA